jgi:CDP-glucose 4,6-dehydratase
MKAIMENRPAIIRYPNAIRPWQHVLEPLRGYLSLAEILWRHGEDYACAWNFGPDEADSKPVSWVADYLTALWGEGAMWKSNTAYHPPEANYLKLDCSKAKSLLGWRPILDLETTLQWTVDWYRTYFQEKNMRIATETEILKYEQLLKRIFKERS